MRIADVQVRALDVALTEPFGIATGAQLSAENALVRLTLDDGSVGLGEAAPFPAVNGETRAIAVAAVERAREALIGADGRRWQKLARLLGELCPEAPSARAAIEMALLDALCRRARISLWTFFGGAESELVTDITIVTGGVDHAASAAARAIRDGFSTLKVKIGAASLDEDVERLRAIVRVAPAAALVLDANASLSADQALTLLARSPEACERVALFEQPTAPGDLEGMRAVRTHGRVRVAADESARSAADVVELARADAVDVVNLKITKTGIAEALDMAAVARAHGLDTMIGGMVETRLAMTVSACLAAGRGGFAFVDLDTPLFLTNDPFRGGFEQIGPRLIVSGIDGGHGVELDEAR